MKFASIRVMTALLGASLCIPAQISAKLENDSAVHPLGHTGKGGPQRVFAIGGDHTFIHDVGLLKMRVSNIGTMGNRYENNTFGASWRGGEYLFVSGLWIGAVGGDKQKHVSTAQYETELLPEIDATWTIYESFEGAEGGNRIAVFSPGGADDDGDGLEDEDFLNGFDDDRDGFVDEDFEAISTQMFSCMYRDDTAEALAFNTEHVPLNLLIKQRSFQWSTPGLNESVGFEFEVINNGDQILEDIHLGFFSDSDAGPRDHPQYFLDDYVGWTRYDTVFVEEHADPAICANKRVSFEAVAMWDAPDAQSNVQGGDVSGVFGSLFLGHTTDFFGLSAPSGVGINTLAWFSSQGEETDPQDDIERYDLMASGRKATGQAEKPADYRYVMSAGAFSRLDPGESLVFQAAYVVGDGFRGFKRNAAAVQRVYDGEWVDRDQDPSTATGGAERCLQILQPGEVILWEDPCSTIFPPATLEITKPGPCVYVNDDCDICTGWGGREYLDHWIARTPPRSPNVEFVPGDRKVVIRWDNSSENHLDAYTGEPRFAGYRIWRADTWDRPMGSTAPEAEDFRLLMTLWLRDPDRGLPPPEFLTDTAVSQLLDSVRQEEVLPLEDPDPGDDFTPYPVGRYEFTDDRGVINGIVSFYSVTAFSIQEDELGEHSILSPVPASSEEYAVVARNDAQPQVDCDLIYVVPNPYKGGAEWDLHPSEGDPTGTKIALVNLPQGTSTVRIYTMAGDLVLSHVHEESAVTGGTFWWDLVTRSGQDAASGVYLFTVEYDGGICRGKFIVIR